METSRSPWRVRLLAAAVVFAAGTALGAGSSTFRVGLRIVAACDVERSALASPAPAGVRCGARVPYVESIAREPLTPVARALMQETGADGGFATVTVITVAF